MNSADAWREDDSDAYQAELVESWPHHPEGDMTPILEASIEAAKQRHPSASDDVQGVVLTAADRCDAACPAGALYRWLGNTGPLDLCHHHHARLSSKMEADGWVVIGTNPGLHAELYSGDSRSQGSDH